MYFVALHVGVSDRTRRCSSNCFTINLEWPVVLYNFSKTCLHSYLYPARANNSARVIARRYVIHFRQPDATSTDLNSFCFPFLYNNTWSQIGFARFASICFTRMISVSKFIYLSLVKAQKAVELSVQYGPVLG